METLPELFAQILLTAENCSPDFDFFDVDDFYDFVGLEENLRFDYGTAALIKQALEILE